MKKTLSVLFVLLAVLLTSCGHREYPTEEVRLGRYDTASVIEGTVGETLQLKLNNLAKNTMVEASLDDLSVSVNEEGILTLPLYDVGDRFITVKLSSKRYEEATLTWTLRSNPLPLDFEIENEQEELSFPEGTAEFKAKVTASVENTEFSIEPEGMCEFIPDEEQEKGKTTGTLKFKLPEVGTENYIISAGASNTEVKKKSLTIKVIPKLEVELSESHMVLYPYQESTLIIKPEKEDAIVNARVKSGDAEILIRDKNTILVTGGEHPSSIYICAESEGFVPFETIISVDIPVPPSSAFNSQRPNKVISTKEYDYILNGIFEETNRIRLNNGLEALERVKACDTPAMIRAEEANTLWSHTRPDGRNCFSVHEDVGLSFDIMGENLFSANTYLEPDEVLKEWMDSPGHRANILQPLYKGIGLGYYEGDKYNFWVQIFVG